MKMKTLGMMALCALIVGAVAAPATAGEETASGTVTYVPITMETMEMADGSMMQRSHIRGIVLVDDASSSIHLSSQDCFGTTVVAADGSATANGYCDAIDADGDLWWIWWHNSPDKNVWGFMGGTGKFMGVKGEGTSTPIVQKADGSSVVAWNGAWTMP